MADMLRRKAALELSPSKAQPCFIWGKRCRLGVSLERGGSNACVWTSFVCGGWSEMLHSLMVLDLPLRVKEMGESSDWPELVQM